MVRLNRFVDTGYAGIILGSDGQTVENNVFVRTMGTLNDGAAVYTNCNASIIRDNIILDTIGDLEYSHPWWPLGHGIWPEFLSDFHDTVITDNTIYGSNGHGIFLPNNFDCTISGNVIVDNRRAALGLYIDANPNQGHVITGNTLVSTEPTRRIDRPENLSHWWLPPYTEPTRWRSSTTPRRLRQHEPHHLRRPDHASAGSSARSPTTPSSRPSANGPPTRPGRRRPAASSAAATPILLFNDTEEAGGMAVPAGNWTRPDGSAVGSTITLQPFGERGAGHRPPSVPPSPPYHAASGIDWRADTPVTSYLGDDGSIFADGFESGDTGAWID